MRWRQWSPSRTVPRGAEERRPRRRSRARPWNWGWKFSSRRISRRRIFSMPCRKSPPTCSWWWPSGSFFRRGCSMCRKRARSTSTVRFFPSIEAPAPIQWAIINGETETGVTTMYMEKKLDAGDMLLWRATPIYPDDTAGSLHDRLSQIGAELLAETLDRPGKRELERHGAGPFPGDLRAHAGKKRRQDRLGEACARHRALHPGDVPLAWRFHLSR